MSEVKSTAFFKKGILYFEHPRRRNLPLFWDPASFVPDIKPRISTKKQKVTVIFERINLLDGKPILFPSKLIIGKCVYNNVRR